MQVLSATRVVVQKFPRTGEVGTQTDLSLANPLEGLQKDINRIFRFLEEPGRAANSAPRVTACRSVEVQTDIKGVVRGGAPCYSRDTQTSSNRELCRKPERRGSSRAVQPFHRVATPAA